ncbi:MAG: two-component sensor histidine kinase, partial [Deltaproteobacteria bacterium]|nr:two-component sensor histidine kinase [Deltaproteobacteria bacterium]
MSESNSISESGTEQGSNPRKTTQDGQQNIQPFRLVKYFSFTGFFVILVFSLLLSFFISQQAKNMLLKQSEDYARLVAENLNHQVFLQFIMPMAQIYGYIRLREEVQYKHLDAVVRSTIHGFKVEKVNVYDFDGMIIYSTNKKLIETKGQTSPSYKAALAGNPSHTLIVQPGWFGGVGQTRTLQTFTPFRAEKAFVGSVGEVLAVFEIFQDLTEDYAEIIKFQYLSIAISFLLSILLFVVLRQIVKRADQIIEERNSEWRRLQERLHQSEKLAILGQMVAAVSHEI